MTNNTKDQENNLQIIEKQIQLHEGWLFIWFVCFLVALVCIPFSIFYANKTLGLSSFCWIMATFVQICAKKAKDEQEHLKNLIKQVSESEKEENEDSDQEYYVLDPVSLN